MADMWLLNCPTYEDYLDTFISRNDILYLRNIAFCRMLVDLGYRSTSDVYTPKQFHARKLAAKESLQSIQKSIIHFSKNINVKDPVLRELAKREKSNNLKLISTIFFIVYRDKAGFEISGYIDFEDSLKKSNALAENCIDWVAVYEERKWLRPRPTDLSFYNNKTSLVCHNDSNNYTVIHNSKGLAFKHKGDRKIIQVGADSRNLVHENYVKSMILSEKYGHVIFYDHIVRKKV